MLPLIIGVSAAVGLLVVAGAVVGILFATGVLGRKKAPVADAAPAPPKQAAPPRAAREPRASRGARESREERRPSRRRRRTRRTGAGWLGALSAWLGARDAEDPPYRAVPEPDAGNTASGWSVKLV